MAKTRTKKATLNILTSALLEVVALVCGLILPRLILRNYGSAYNGITSSATQFLSMISILTLGVSGSTRAALYKPLADHDVAATSAIVRATERYMRKVGLVLSAYIIILAIVYPLVVDTGFDFWDVSLLILAVGINSFGNYFFGVTYQAFLSADQSIYISNIFTIITTILNTVLSVILIYCGFSIQVVKLGSAVIFFLKPFMQNVYVTRKYQLEKRCEPDNRALSKRKDVLAHSIATIVHDNTDMIVLTIFCGVKIVSVYTVYNFIMATLKKMLTIFSNGTETIFGDMWAKNELEKINKHLANYEYFVLLLVSTVFSTAIVMILPFVKLYTKGVTDVEYILPLYSVVIIIAQAFYCFRVPYVSLVQGVGKYKETKKGAFYEAGINIILSVIFVQFIGIVGVAVGTLVANIFRTVQYALFVEKNIITRKKFSFVRIIVSTLLLLAIISVIGRLLFDRFSGLGWLQWIGCGAATLVIGCVISSLFSLIYYRESFLGLLSVAKKMIRFRKK